jgi:hypothetical protein
MERSPLLASPVARALLAALGVGLVVTLASGAQDVDGTSASSAVAVAHQTAAGEPAAGGPFDGRSLTGWRTLRGDPVAETLDAEGYGWELAGGVLHLVPSGRRPDGTRGPNFSIVTAEEYGDFSLDFEWRIVAGGNNGIKYRVRRYGPKMLGCEYQIFDDVGGGVPFDHLTSCGSLYGLFAPPADKTLHPADAWNAGRIAVRGDRVEHWLNGRLVVEATVGDEAWERQVRGSKFVDRADFGRNRRGRIMITDHGAETWFRGFVFAPAAE